MTLRDQPGEPDPQIGRRPAKTGTGTAGSGADFDAFISYSHAVDGRLAPAVRTGLEQLARPWLRRRALRVFQDASGLGATPGLWSTIASTLDRSRFFVLLASPESAASSWVQQEIGRFLQVGSADRFLIALTDGECRWDDAAGDFDWARTTALPGRLAGVFAEEPLYVDLRWARTEDQVDLRHTRFRQAVADLAAPIHGRARDELEGVDLAEFAKARRARRIAVTGLAVLTVLSMVMGGLAVGNAREAGRQADASEAGRLAALSESVVTERTDLAILLARHGLRTSASRAGELALARAMTQPLATAEPVPGTATPGGGLVLAGTTQVLDLDAAGSTAALWVDDEVLLWSVGRPTESRRLPTPRAHLRRLDLSADGTRLLLVDTISDQARVLDVVSGAELATYPAADAAFLPDGEVITVADDGLVQRWSGTSLRWRAAVGVSSADDWILAVGADGRTAAIGTEKGTVDQLDTRTGRLDWHVDDRGAVSALAFSRDGRWLAVGGSSPYVSVLDTERGGLVASMAGLSATVTNLAFAVGDETLLVGTHDGRLRLFDRGNERLTDDAPAHDFGLSGMVAAPDGRAVFTSSTDGVRRWDLTLGQPTWSLAVPHDNNDVRAVASSPDGNLIASVTLRHTDLWRVGETTPYATVDVTASSAAFVTQDVLAVAGRTGITLHSTRDGGLVGTIPTGDALGEPFATPQGQLVVVSGAGTLDVWDPTTSVRVRRVPLGGGDLRDVSLSTDGRLAIIARPDGVQIHDTEAGAVVSRWAPSDIDQRELQTFRVAMRPDGAEAAVGQPNGRVIRIATGTGRVLGELRALTGDVTDLAYSADGTMLVTAGEVSGYGTSHALRVWDAATGQLVADREAHDRTITAVAFSADRRWMLSGGADGRVLVWTGPGEWAARSCAAAGRDLTPAERDRYLRPADHDVTVC